MSGPEHVVVIGAGITGALTAHRLLEAGVRVTILEAKEKGAGASSRSAACIRQQFSTPATVAAMIYSVRAYERFAEEFRCAPGDGQVLVQNGYLFLYDRPEVSDDPAAAARRWELGLGNVDMQRKVGLTEVEVLTPEQVGERFEHVDTERLLGATFCPTDGFLHPDVIYMEGFRRVLELGGDLRQHDEVIGGDFDGQGGLCAVRTSRDERIEADLFVNATNAWAPRLSQLLGGSDLPIAALKRYLYFLQRSERVDPDRLVQWPMTITGSRAYCRPENREQLLMGWAHAVAAEPEADWADQDRIEPEYFHKSGLDNYGYAVWLKLAESLPGLEPFAGLAATTSGYYAVTPDHNPLFGFDPKQPRLLHAAGFSGHGAMMGPFSAAVVTAMAMAGRTLREVEVGGRTIDLSDLLLGRELRHGEGMVI